MRRLLVIALAGLAGCSAGEDRRLAEQAVADFHHRLDAGQFEAMYAGSADDLHKATTQQDFVAFLGAVHRKLGKVKSATQQTWKINYQPSGTFVALSYSTSYAEGEAAEQFVYRMEDGKALLVGYHVNSNAFILK